MSSVLFIRHAETAMAGRFCGHLDPELNERGLAQAASLAAVLASEQFEKVYSSDLCRARSTASAIASPRGLPVELCPALREIDFGRWEGLCWEEIEQWDGEYARKWLEDYPNLPAPEGETFAAFQVRVTGELNRLAGRTYPMAVVTHAGVLRVVLQTFCGCSEAEAWEKTRSYCCVVRIGEIE